MYDKYESATPVPTSGIAYQAGQLQNSVGELQGSLEELEKRLSAFLLPSGVCASDSEKKAMRPTRSDHGQGLCNVSDTIYILGCRIRDLANRVDL